MKDALWLYSAFLYFLPPSLWEVSHDCCLFLRCLELWWRSFSFVCFFWQLLGVTSMWLKKKALRATFLDLLVLHIGSNSLKKILTAVKAAGMTGAVGAASPVGKHQHYNMFNKHIIHINNFPLIIYLKKKKKSKAWARFTSRNTGRHTSFDQLFITGYTF